MAKTKVNVKMTDVAIEVAGKYTRIVSGRGSISVNGRTTAFELDENGHDAQGRSISEIIASAFAERPLTTLSDRRDKPRKEKRG